VRQVGDHAQAGPPGTTREHPQQPQRLDTLEVVHHGHAVPVQPLRGAHQALEIRAAHRAGLEPHEEPHRMLAHDPAGLARRIALDAAAGRVGGVARDAGFAQGRAVHPQRVVVLAVQQHRPLAAHGVQARPLRWLTPGVRVPATARDRPGLRLRGEEGGDPPKRLVARGRPCERHLVQRARPGQQVQVRVHQSGRHRRTAGVEAHGVGPQQGLQFRRATDGQHPPPGHGDGVRPFVHVAVRPDPGLRDEQAGPRLHVAAAST
jgi:hypothetical protein